MPARAGETARLRRYWDEHAPHYDRQMRFFDRNLFGDTRAWVCQQATGEVLEVAVGTGLNLELYPEGVRLTGIDLSPAMLERARDRARQLGRDVDLAEDDAHALDFPGRAPAPGRSRRRLGLAGPGRPEAAGADHHPGRWRALLAPPGRARPRPGVPNPAARTVQARDRGAAGSPQAGQELDWVRSGDGPSS